MTDPNMDERASVGRTLHCHLDIRGALRPGHRVKGMLRNPTTGKLLTAAEVREWLMDRLAEGKKVIPLGEPCEGFSYETGCPGHRPCIECGEAGYHKDLCSRPVPEVPYENKDNRLCQEQGSMSRRFRQ